MSFEQVKAGLKQYAQANQSAFTNFAFTKKQFALKFPTIKGPTGIGKTMAVEKYAEECSLLFQKWEGSGMDEETLCVRLSNFVDTFRKAPQEGALLLIERFDRMSPGAIEFLRSYTEGKATATVKLADKGPTTVTVTRIPNLDIVAEVTE